MTSMRISTVLLLTPLAVLAADANNSLTRHLHTTADLGELREKTAAQAIALNARREAFTAVPTKERIVRPKPKR
jgi:hypothetical protein